MQVGLVVPAPGTEKPDELGDFLRAYFEYLDGKRPYDKVPVLGGGTRPVLRATPGILGKTVEDGFTRGVVLAVHYDNGDWVALVQREDGSLERMTLNFAKVVS